SLWSIPQGQFGEDSAGLRINSHAVWNILRRAIMRLEWHRIGSHLSTGFRWTAGRGFRKSPAQSPSWNDAIQAHVSEQEVEISTANLNSTVQNGILSSGSASIYTVRWENTTGYIP